MKKFMNKLSNAPSSNTGGQSGSGRTVAGAPYSQPPGPPPAQPQECDQPPPQQPAYGGGQPGYGGGYAAPPGPPPSSRPSNNAQQSMPGQQAYGAPGGEDPFAALRRYDTVFIVDDSEVSLTSDNGPSSMSDKPHVQRPARLFVVYGDVLAGSAGSLGRRSREGRTLR